MSATLVTSAAAGWYHDPSDSGSWRWWDGATWTAHVRPKAETAPIAIAEPVSQPVIPQPAQPIQPVGPVSLTPATPASEQLYWHSADAEIVQIPGRSATSQHAHPSTGTTALPPYGMHEWGDVGSPQTAGIWLLAFLPILSIALQVAFGVVAGILQAGGIFVPNFVYWVVLLVLAWIFAGLDAKSLAARGYTAPRVWWMLLLPPFAYFIARGRAVRREGQRAWPPELLFFLTFMGLVLSAVAVYLSVMSMLNGVLPGLPA